MTQPSNHNLNDEVNVNNTEQTESLNGTKSPQVFQKAQLSNNKQTTSALQHRRQHLNHTSNILIITMLLLTLLGIFILSHLPENKSLPQKIQQIVTANPVKKVNKLPKILWLYTYHELQGQNAINQIQIQYLKHLGLNNNYDVRLVNSWNAYNWLTKNSIQNITKTIQNTKIDITVCPLLKLALLKQHGGVMINDLNLTMNGNNLTWIEKMFEPNNNQSDKYISDPSSVQIYVPRAQPSGNYNYYLYQHLIASLPQSKFIIQSYNLLQNIITTGHISLNPSFGFLKPHPQANVDKLPYPIATVMTILVHEFSQTPSLVDPYKYFSIQAKKVKNVVDLQDMSSFQGQRYLKDKHTVLADIDMMFNTHDRVKQIVDAVLVSQYHQPIDQGSLIHHIFSVPNNQKLLLMKQSPRQISFCLVFMDKMNSKQIQQAKFVLKNQQYPNKQLVVFSDQDSHQDDIFVVKSSDSQVRNIEVALTKYCKKSGYAVLMKAGQTLSQTAALKNIAQAVKSRQVVGASINLVAENSLHKAKQQYLKFSRSIDGVRNRNFDLMNGILNHMRIISIDAFRYVPHFEFHDAFGTYLKDRIVVLQPLLQMLVSSKKINDAANRHNYIYIKRKYADQFHFPTKAVLIKQDTFIHTTKLDEIDQGQFQKTIIRTDVQSIEQSLIKSSQFGFPYSKQLVFNQGTQFHHQLTQAKQIIPKIIHQVWLGSQLPQANLYFLDKVQKLHPHYQIKLWNDKNITQQNFPNSYDILITLLKFQKAGRSVNFNKFTTVKDIMSKQIMYQHGGIWLQAGTNIFRPVFDNFLQYKLVLGSQTTLMHRWKQGMNFYANQRHSQYIFRLSNYRNVNRMRFYYPETPSIAGEIDFSQILQGNEESSSDILILHNEYFYPADISHYPYSDLCLKMNRDLNKDESFEFEYKEYVLLPDCQKNYPMAFGQTHNMFKKSWRALQ